MLCMTIDPCMLAPSCSKAGRHKLHGWGRLALVASSVVTDSSLLDRDLSLSMVRSAASLTWGCSGPLNHPVRWPATESVRLASADRALRSASTASSSCVAITVDQGPPGSYLNLQVLQCIAGCTLALLTATGCETPVARFRLGPCSARMWQRPSAGRHLSPG